MKEKMQRRLFIILFLVPTLIAFVLFYVYPLITVFVTTLCKWDYQNLNAPALLPLDDLLANYRYIFTEYPYFKTALVNSLKWALCGALIATPIALITALVTSWKLPGWKWMKNIYIIPNIISAAAIGLIFLQLYKHGLAYKKEMNVNWCTGCKCVLANEEVVNGVCERCGSEVVHRVKSQWMLKITAYADKLIDGLDGLDYIERVSTQQKNWIGRSHGAEVNFGTTAGDTLTVYTTRCDTLFGATYMVISPEHALLKAWLEKGIIKNAEAVKAYQAEAARKSDFERSELNKEKTGVQLDGVMGINPVNETEIPIFISDYVLSTYGTGAIMAVPAHDTRDWEFAKKFGLPIIEVVKGNTPSNLDEAAFTDVATGTLVNSGFLNGLSVVDAKKKMITWLEETGKGRDKVNYKLRDWVFSRQRYWGELKSA